MAKRQRFAFTISNKNIELLSQKAIKAKMTKTDFLNNCIAGKDIIVIDDLKEMVSELKAVGRNLNQLTILCNLEKITCADISDVKSKLNEIYLLLNTYTDRSGKSGNS